MTRLASNLVPCPRCGHAARIDVALKKLPRDEAARLSLARHQKLGPCIIGTFELQAKKQDIVPVSHAWRLLKAGIVTGVSGPRSTTVNRRGLDLNEDEDIIQYGQWIPRWASVVWQAWPNAKNAIEFGTALKGAADEERAAFLTAFDLGGVAAARSVGIEIRQRVELRKDDESDNP